MTRSVNFLIALFVISPRLWCDGELTPTNSQYLKPVDLIEYDMSHKYRAVLSGENKKWSIYICGKLIQYDTDFLANRKPQTITCLGIDF